MSYSIHYRPQAETVLNSLDSEEISRVRGAIHQLGEFRLPDPNVVRLKGVLAKEPAYVLLTGNDLGVLFTASHDSITILDVFNRRFAERYA